MTSRNSLKKKIYLSKRPETSGPDDVDRDELKDILLASFTVASTKESRIAALAWAILSDDEKNEYISSLYKRLGNSKKTADSTLKAVRAASKKDFFPKTPAAVILSKAFQLFDEEDWMKFCDPVITFYKSDYEDSDVEE